MKLRCLCLLILLSFMGCKDSRETFHEETLIDTKEDLSVSKEESVVEEQKIIKEDKTLEVNSKEQSIYAYICGAVRHPGVYQLEAQSRIYQLIERAGGLLEEADEKSLNQAQILEDGMQITVYTTQEIQEQKDVSSVVIKGNEGSAQDEKVNVGKVNINEAEEAVLMTLSGIGSSRARAIISYRNEHGAFLVIEDLMKVEGIKEGLFQKIKEHITI